MNEKRKRNVVIFNWALDKGSILILSEKIQGKTNIIYTFYVQNIDRVLGYGFFFGYL